MCIWYLKVLKLGIGLVTALDVSSLSSRQGSLVLDMDVEVEVDGRKEETTTAALTRTSPAITRRLITLQRGHRSMDTSLTIPVIDKYSADTYIVLYFQPSTLQLYGIPAGLTGLRYLPVGSLLYCAVLF